MSPLEQLGSFFSFCQACGLIPYTIEYDSITKTFVRFSFSFRQLTTWWFILIAILQLVTPYLIIKIPQSFIKKLKTDHNNAPITINILISIIGFTFLFNFLVLRWMILFRYRRLQRVVKLAQKVEKLLICDGTYISLENSVSKRFIIGFILIIILGCGSLYSSSSRLLLVFDETNYLLPGFVCSIQLLFVIMTDCIYLLTHLCCYIVAYYTKMLTLNLENWNKISKSQDTQPSCDEFDFRISRNTTLNTINKNIQIFEHICNISSELQYFFSFPMLFLLTTKFIAVIGTAFTYIFTLLSPNAVLNDENFFLLWTSTTDWIRILVILSSADMPIYQVRLLRERVITLLHSKFCKASHEKIMIMMAFLTQIKEDRFRLSAMGLFNVGRHLIPPLVGAIVTYLVILLEN